MYRRYPDYSGVPLQYSPIREGPLQSPPATTGEPTTGTPVYQWSNRDVQPKDVPEDDSDEEPSFAPRPLDIEYDWTSHIANTTEIPVTWWRD
ncbi:hypothetical protein TMEN_6961 [Trichophyton mentagrophytes]|nr:hypothetical protein TMEN_6961 [Trichophyton mentagrophytes]